MTRAAHINGSRKRDAQKKNVHQKRIARCCVSQRIVTRINDYIFNANTYLANFSLRNKKKTKTRTRGMKANTCVQTIRIIFVDKLQIK